MAHVAGGRRVYFDATDAAAALDLYRAHRAQEPEEKTRSKSEGSRTCPSQPSSARRRRRPQPARR